MNDPDRDITLRIRDALSLNIACLGPVGKLPRGAGTAGSALAALAAPWLFLPLPIWGRAVLLTAVFFIGGAVAGRVERILGQEDPNRISIDEVLGQWLTFLPFAVLEPWQIVVGFLAFRLFDILKPWPIRRSEHWLPGGLGVMIDDALAGIYGAGLLWLSTATITCFL